jgi:archaellum component FlaC
MKHQVGTPPPGWVYGPWVGATAELRLALLEQRMHHVENDLCEAREDREALESGISSAHEQVELLAEDIDRIAAELAKDLVSETQGRRDDFAEIREELEAAASKAHARAQKLRDLAERLDIVEAKQKRAKQ